MEGQAQPPPPPAGWYPDPEGAGQRYWDGTRWTDHHHAPPQVESAPDSRPSVSEDQELAEFQSRFGISPHETKRMVRELEADRPGLRTMRDLGRIALAEPKTIELRVPPQDAERYLTVDLTAQWAKSKFRPEQIGDGNFTFVRRYWPWWIIALCFLLIGFLLMLSGKREDTISYRVEPGPHGSTVYVVTDCRGPKGMIVGLVAATGGFPSEWIVKDETEADAR